MRHHARTPIAVLLPCLLLAGASYAAPQEVKIAKSGETSLRAVLGGKTVQITLHTATLRKSDPGFPLALDYYDEVSIVQGMSIIVGGKTIWVPRSAYADLFDARKGFLQFKKGAFVLIIVGADGADLYSVHVYFDAKRVIKRGVYDSFAPQKPSEETLYFAFPPIG
jgi:hypothetical protein